MIAIAIFGMFALPFAGLSKSTYGNLTALSVLYCGMTTIQGIYVVIEASYIPIFMRSVGWFKPPARIGDGLESEAAATERNAKHVLTKGTRVYNISLRPESPYDLYQYLYLSRNVSRGFLKSASNSSFLGMEAWYIRFFTIESTMFLLL